MVLPVSAKKWLGFRRDLPDERDYYFAAAPSVMAALPPKVSLRPRFPSILNQGPLGSCVWNALANVHRYAQAKQGVPKVMMPSRLFGYYNTRAMEGTTRSDAGCSIRDAIKSVVQQGVCDERLWPYNIGRFAMKPTRAAYRDGLKHQAIQYQRIVQTAAQIKGCLASDAPFLVGLPVYPSFEEAPKGQVPLPDPIHEQLQGWHCITITGYDDEAGVWEGANSWDTDWGDQGYLTLPYPWLTSPSLAVDLWTVRLVET